MNAQKPEPFDKTSGEFLDFHSMFLTIQGEGPFTGHRAVFIRLAGCNLQCPACDTEYTQGRERRSARSLATDALALTGGKRNHLIVITGGEPLRQDIGPLIYWLRSESLIVQIESNGLLQASGATRRHLVMPGVHLVVSPKTSKINEDTAHLARTFKYVLNHRHVADDGLPTTALGHKAAPVVARPPPGYVGPVYLNPEDSKDPEENRLNLEAVKNSCIKHGYVAGVQLHKLLDIA